MPPNKKVWRKCNIESWEENNEANSVVEDWISDRFSLHIWCHTVTSGIWVLKLWWCYDQAGTWCPRGQFCRSTFTVSPLLLNSDHRSLSLCSKYSGSLCCAKRSHNQGPHYTHNNNSRPGDAIILCTASDRLFELLQELKECKPAHLFITKCFQQALF